MREIWTAAGTEDMWSYNRSAHTIGTCRMGNDVDNAVVSSEGQSFDIPNLYIADNSVFPSALSANPGFNHYGAFIAYRRSFFSKEKKSGGYQIKENHQLTISNELNQVYGKQ